MRRLSRLIKCSVVSIIGGSLSFFIVFDKSTNMSIFNKIVFHHKAIILGSTIGLAIDAIINPYILYRRIYLEAWTASNKQLLRTSNLPPEQFLRGYVMIYYLLDDLGINIPNNISQKEAKKSGYEMIWIIDNVFYRIKPYINDNDKLNDRFLINLLSNLHVILKTSP